MLICFLISEGKHFTKYIVGTCIVGYPDPAATIYPLTTGITVLVCVPVCSLLKLYSCLLLYWSVQKLQCACILSRANGT